MRSLSSPSATASSVRGSVTARPALPELRKRLLVPAAAPQPPVRPAQQPGLLTQRGPRPAAAPAKAAPALWQNLAPKAPPSPAPASKPCDPVAAARAEAEAIIATARADAERLRAKVQKRAEAEGHVRGKAQARVELRRMMREARAIQAEARTMRETALDQLGDEVAETVVALANAVLCRKVAQSSEDLRALAVELIAAARDPRGLRANPADAPALEGVGVAVAPDPTLARGGLVLFAADGERDARLEARIARLEAALKAGDPR